MFIYHIVILCIYLQIFNIDIIKAKLTLRRINFIKLDFIPLIIIICTNFI